jgi:hypothetical protein
MRPIGFSTGALALGDFAEGLRILSGTWATAVELSALRQHELQPLVDALPRLPLQRFKHVSVHLPSSADPSFEGAILDVTRSLPHHWLLVVHPNIIRAWERWKALGSRLCIENMDKRKPLGQTARQLDDIFARLNDATFCFDLGHAYQVDPTMSEAVLILQRFKSRLRQLHVSEVNSESKHDPLSLETEAAFSRLARLIPADTPAILESRLPRPTVNEVEAEMRLVREILSSALSLKLAGD